MNREKPRKPPPRWIPLPLEPAAPWLRLPAFTRSLGLELLRVSQDEPIEGISLDQVEDWALRAVAPDARERKGVRHAVRSIVEAGLLVAVRGGVRLLYSMESYADHRRMVHLRSTEGARKVDGPSTDGAPKVVASSTEGQPTVEAKPSETQDGTEPALTEEERKKRETDTHTTGVRVRGATSSVVEFGDEATLEDPVSFTAAVLLRFRKLHRDADKGDPAMGGKQVGQFPVRLANTAHDMGREWHELLAEAHARWVAEDCPGCDVSSPYAAFVARFDRLAKPGAATQGKGFRRGSSEESHRRSGTSGNGLLDAGEEASP